MQFKCFVYKMARSSIILGLLFVGVILTSMTGFVSSIPRSQFYTFGTSAGDAVIGRTDDGSSPQITLQGGFFPYFGQDHTSLYVSHQLLFSWLVSSCKVCVAVKVNRKFTL